MYDTVGIQSKPDQQNALILGGRFLFRFNKFVPFQSNRSDPYDTSLAQPNYYCSILE